MKKLICGVGYNSKREHKTEVNSKISTIYNTWRNMIERCYNPEMQKKFPSYVGCIVSNDWHDFQDFADWYASHKYTGRGYQLDKDILIPNNKIYSSDTCCFVPAELNSLLTNSAAARGDFPQGVSFQKRLLKFRARLSVNGKQKDLGFFDCPNEAHQAYRIAKEAYVKRIALEWQDRIADNVFQALMNWTLDS